MVIEISIVPQKLNEQERNAFTNEVKSAIKNMVITQYPKKDSIVLEFNFYFPFPENFSEKEKEELFGRPNSTKPAMKDLLKFVIESLTKILWKDDAQIFLIEAFKGYSDKPRTIIKVEEV